MVDDKYIYNWSLEVYSISLASLEASLWIYVVMATAWREGGGGGVIDIPIWRLD